MKGCFLSFCFLLLLQGMRSQCTNTIAPVAGFGGPGTYMNGPSGFLGPFQICNNALVYDTLSTSSRYYYVLSGSTLTLKDAFSHTVILQGNSTLNFLGGIGNVYVYKMANATVNGTLSPSPITCSAVSFPTLACPAPTITGIATQSHLKEILVYPNPANDILFFSNLPEKGSSITLIDLNGKTLLNEEFTQRNGKISLNQFNEGIYFIRLTGKEGEILKKIVIRK